MSRPIEIGQQPMTLPLTSAKLNEKDAMNWFVYETVPVDHDWDYLPSVEGVAKNLAAMKVEMVLEYGKANFARLSYDEFMECWISAQDAARADGWEGEHHQTPRVLWFPIEDAFRPGFIIKQSNNGQTYVISPVDLPYLQQPTY